MSNGSSPQSRRAMLKTCGGIGVLALAGCTSNNNGGGGGDTTQSSGGGDSGGGSSGGDSGGSTSGGGGSSGEQTKFTFGSNYNPEQHGMDNIQMYAYPELWDRVEEASDGAISVNRVGQSQVCGEGNCPDKVSANVVQVGTSTFGNASDSWPSLDMFVIGYMYPTGIPEGLLAEAHVATRKSLWERYWLPFAKKHGVIPLYFTAPTKRDVMLGTDIASNRDDPFLLPEDIKDLKIRRTLSRVSGTVIEEWGATAVNVAWSDTIQGLKSGVVDGLETYTPALFPFGMAPSVGEIIANQWGGFSQVAWANVDWLKGLPEEHQQILAEQTKRTYTDIVKLGEEAWTKRLGYVKDPPADSGIAKEDIQLNLLSDDQMDAWREPVRPDKHPDLYTDVIKDVERLTGESGWIDYMYDLARGNSVPKTGDEFEIEAWWDDILPKL